MKKDRNKTFSLNPFCCIICFEYISYSEFPSNNHIGTIELQQVNTGI